MSLKLILPLIFKDIFYVFFYYANNSSKIAFVPKTKLSSPTSVDSAPLNWDMCKIGRAHV